MTPLDLRTQPPRSAHAELDGLVFLPRTIDKLRSQLPGGHPGVYFINAQVKGMSGFLLDRLGVSESDMLEAVRAGESDDDVARWLRERTDASQYESISETIRHLKLKHSGDEQYVRGLYAETLQEHPELVVLIEIMDEDDRRMFTT